MRVLTLHLFHCSMYTGLLVLGCRWLPRRRRGTSSLLKQHLTRPEKKLVFLKILENRQLYYSWKRYTGYDNNILFFYSTFHVCWHFYALYNIHISKIISLVIFVCLAMWSIRNLKVPCQISWTFRFLIDHIARQTNITSDIIFDTTSAMSNIFSNIHIYIKYNKIMKGRWVNRSIYRKQWSSYKEKNHYITYPLLICEFEKMSYEFKYECLIIGYTT